MIAEHHQNPTCFMSPLERRAFVRNWAQKAEWGQRRKPLSPFAILVGAAGFELATLCSQRRCAVKLFALSQRALRLGERSLAHLQFLPNRLEFREV